jgi:HNH endonuclease
MSQRRVPRSRLRPGHSMEIEAAKTAIIKRMIQTPTGCWEWTGYRKPSGYGEFILKGKKWVSHRLAYVAFKGPIEPGMFVCHSCDNPACVNPEHLWKGTHQDNMNDAKAKKRIARANRTHCPRGHSFAEHGYYQTGKNWRVCSACELGRQRLRTGWPVGLAYSLPAGEIGYRPPEAGPVVHVKAQPHNSVKTHCKYGHEFTPENTYIFPSNGRRGCRKCAVLRHKKPRLSLRGEP